jgi:hypothetical protein
MLELHTVLSVVAMHYIFDFLAQNQWIALNKTRSFRGLSAHVGVYAIGLLLVIMLALPDGFISPFAALLWVFLNAVLHGITDYITSRFIANNTPVSGKINTNAMFNIVGSDQLVHYMTLFGTLYALSN